MKIKVLTFNLRTESKKDGINYFPNRRERILDMLTRISPDIIGFQEATDNIRKWLRDSLDDYVIVGRAREVDNRGESTLIAYRKNMFDLLRSETFWLSLTPAMPGSSYGMDQSSCPRIAVAALLQPNDGSKPFIFCNTHLDHRGETARLFGAVQIIQYLSSKAHKFILTGDFNAKPDTPEISMITSVQGFPIKDITADLGGTFHGFGKYSDKEKGKIDYIFTNMTGEVLDTFIVPDEPVNGIYISDHHAVGTIIDIE